MLLIPELRRQRMEDVREFRLVHIERPCLEMEAEGRGGSTGDPQYASVMTMPTTSCEQGGKGHEVWPGRLPCQPCQPFPIAGSGQEVSCPGISHTPHTSDFPPQVITQVVMFTCQPKCSGWSRVRRGQEQVWQEHLEQQCWLWDSQSTMSGPGVF